MNLPPRCLLSFPSTSGFGEIIAKEIRQQLISHSISEMLLSFCYSASNFEVILANDLSINELCCLQERVGIMKKISILSKLLSKFCFNCNFADKSILHHTFLKKILLKRWLGKFLLWLFSKQHWPSGRNQIYRTGILTLRRELKISSWLNNAKVYPA